MQTDLAAQILAGGKSAQTWLQTATLADTKAAHRDLVQIAKSGVSLDLMAELIEQLGETLPQISDPDRALKTLEQFFQASRSPLALAALFERDIDALPSLLTLFAASQYLSSLLIREPESYDLLRITDGHPVARQKLVEDIGAEVAALSDEKAVMAVLRRFKHRETLRIAYGDIIRNQPIATVTRQISNLADAICEAAFQFALRSCEAKFGKPQSRQGGHAEAVIMGLGKLGGVELNYSSDIDLIFLYDEMGHTNGERVISNQEYFQRVARQFVKLLSESTEQGSAYRVDFRLRPGGESSELVSSLDDTLRYYDSSGRTWERQALMKARPVAGSSALGDLFLHRLEPWLHTRYLSRADISGIQALKRKIEKRAIQQQADHRNVKTGTGGIRDIEFTIQFLQLLGGGETTDTRTTNTLAAIVLLESAGALTHQERTLLEENYQFLRKLEHRLQIMFDMQTHVLPTDSNDLARLARRMDFETDDQGAALKKFQDDFARRTDENRKILDHLMHNAFGEGTPTEAEVDLVLDPDPTPEFIQQVLGKYEFEDIPAAYRNFMSLSREKISFLSTRRCRHFLAAIASNLLTAISKTPRPDETLVRIAQVSESIGGKGVLWELFSAIEPTMRLFVTICAATPYLSEILVRHPGMIDELMDSLVIDRLPDYEELSNTLNDLSRGAENTAPILHSFKNSNHLRVGVRDLLGKDGIDATHGALADIAEVCFQNIAAREYVSLVQKYGEPSCGMVVLALGKLGGREPNYHSDLDVIFLYESEGSTTHKRADKATTNQHFFSQLGQRITKQFNELGPHGRLFEIDTRLRPTGKSGPLAVSLAGFRKYFESGSGGLWERQSLCKSRPVFGENQACDIAMKTVREIITSQAWRPSDAAAIRDMRLAMEETASDYNLKRGVGGTVDIEFVVQMLQLKNAHTKPEVIVPGTFRAIVALQEIGALTAEQAKTLTDGYRFLREVEARLRLMNTQARHDLPTQPTELKKLAYLLGYSSSQQLVHETQSIRQRNRILFEELFAANSE